MGVGMTYSRTVLRTAGIAVFATLIGGAGVARAGLADWELSEVHLAAEGNEDLRYVELANEVGGCLFPSSTLDLYDASGTLIDTQALTITTVCHGAPTYILLATSAASEHFGVPRDGTLSSPLPTSGQLCFSSSLTDYDCFRWGTVTTPIPDLFGANDTSAIAAAGDGEAMARVDRTHVVANDWSIGAPTPRQPNDGTVWSPPDAGVIVDAGGLADARPRPDAAERSDAAPRADARAGIGNPDYLDLDTVGGASCGCTSTGQRGWGTGLLFLVLLPMVRRRANPPS